MQTTLLFHRAFTACLIFVMLAAGLLPGDAPARAAEPAQYFATPSPLTTSPACTQVDPCTLQAAVDKAAVGDTIYISRGRYWSTTDQVLHLNKSVTLQGGWDGSAGPGIVVNPDRYRTSLDGENTRRVILIGGNVSPILTGLTIRNGRAIQSSGAGIWIDNDTGGDVTVSNCVLHNNFAERDAGAGYLRKGTLTVTDSLVYNNGTTYAGGAFLASAGTTLVLENSVFHNNLPENVGDYGVIAHVDRGNLVMRGSYIYNQTDGSSLISYNTEDGNTLSLENNLFTQNVGYVVHTSGFGSFLVSILHNTFANNDPAAIVIYGSTSGEIANNIFTNHDIVSMSLEEPELMNVHHNLFWNNAADPVTGSNAIFGDPLLNTDYHLRIGSPAIDAGAATTVLVDYDGHPRPMGSAPDIGADERLLNNRFLPLIGKN